MSAQGSSADRVSFARRAWRGARWILLVIFLLYAALVVYRIPAVHEEKLSKQTVAKIEAQRLTIADVDGNHLPPPPDPAQVNATIAGIDANGNGIRDDVELAIFAKYPDSEKIRAAELQYAMELQTQLTGVFDQQTWMAAVQQRDRGFGCLYDISSLNYSTLQKEVEALVLNTQDRRNQSDAIEQYRVSYKLLPGSDCDLTL